jgi:hypothetical protein
MAFWFSKKKQRELREAVLPGENRAVRVVSLLRWTPLPAPPRARALPPPI